MLHGSYLLPMKRPRLGGDILDLVNWLMLANLVAINCTLGYDSAYGEMMSTNSLIIPLMASRRPVSLVRWFAQSQMKLGSTSITQKDILSFVLASEAERVVRVVHVMFDEVLVSADGTDPHERRTFELPMNKD